MDERLRKAGITVFASQQANTSDAKPYLYVLLSGFEIPGQGLYVLNVQVQVRQTVRSLVTSSHIVDAVTWDSQSVTECPARAKSRADIAPAGPPPRISTSDFTSRPPF